MTFQITKTDNTTSNYQAAKFQVIVTASAGLVVEFFDASGALVAVFTRVDHVVKVA